MGSRNIPDMRPGTLDCSQYSRVNQWETQMQCSTPNTFSIDSICMIFGLSLIILILQGSHFGSTPSGATETGSRSTRSYTQIETSGRGRGPSDWSLRT
jgi:hypothetical protein